jgi:hypothetical protein
MRSHAAPAVFFPLLYAAVVEPKPEAPVLLVAESLLNGKSFAIESDDLVGGEVIARGGQTPSLLHLLGAHQHDRGRDVAVGRDGDLLEHPGVTARMQPLDGRCAFAEFVGEPDALPEADDVVETERQDVRIARLWG